MHQYTFIISTATFAECLARSLDALLSSMVTRAATAAAGLDVHASAFLNAGRQRQFVSVCIWFAFAAGSAASL